MSRLVFAAQQLSCCAVCIYRVAYTPHVVHVPMHTAGSNLCTPVLSSAALQAQTDTPILHLQVADQA